MGEEGELQTNPDQHGQRGAASDDHAEQSIEQQVDAGRADGNVDERGDEERGRHRRNAWDLLVAHADHGDGGQQPRQREAAG